MNLMEKNEVPRQRGYRAPGRRGDRAVLAKVSRGTAEPAYGSREAVGQTRNWTGHPQHQAAVEPKRRACLDAECLLGKVG